MAAVVQTTGAATTGDATSTAEADARPVTTHKAAMGLMRTTRASVLDRYREGHGKTHFAKELRDVAVAFIDKLEASVPRSKQAELLTAAFALRALLRNDKKRPFPFVSMVAAELSLDFKDDYADLLKFDPSMFKSRTSDKVKDLNLVQMYEHVKQEDRLELFADVWRMYWLSFVIVKIESSSKGKGK